MKVQNGGIFSTEPNEVDDYFHGDEKGKDVKTVLEKVSRLETDILKFSTQSLGKVFKKVTEAHLEGKVEVTGEYEKCTLFLHLSLETPSDWNSLINLIREELSPYANDKRVLFNVKFKKSGIFACDPGDVNYRDYYTPKKELTTDVTKILSKVRHIEVDAEVFSTLSLMKVFPWTRELNLPNATCILGCSPRTSRAISLEELKSIASIYQFIPGLRIVSAPKVTTIANGAFLNFRNLRAFNHRLPADTPTIVCTPLAKNYFTQLRSPVNAVVSPVKIGNAPVTYNNLLEKYVRKSVEIGACAFENCSSLEHVSARASFIGSAAFAGSGLKSAHLLISRPVREEYATLGDDVFFNCFQLKECFMMAGETCAVTVDSAFDGFFWNCFSLETVCMPNINFCHPPSFRCLDESIRKFPATNSPLAMFPNCFSLKRIDLRSFEKDLTEILPYWLVRHNLKSSLVEVDQKLWLGALLSKTSKTLDSYPKDVKKYVNLCLEKTAGTFDVFQDPDAWKFNECKDKQNPGKQEIYKAPYCDIQTVFTPKNTPKKEGSLNSHFRKVPAIYETDVFSYEPGKPFYAECICKNDPAFSRFNDVCMKWFIQEESLTEEGNKQEDLFEEGK